MHLCLNQKCRQSFSSEAQFCPHCGAPAFANQQWLPPGPEIYSPVNQRSPQPIYYPAPSRRSATFYILWLVAAIVIISVGVVLYTDHIRTLRQQERTADAAKAADDQRRAADQIRNEVQKNEEDKARKEMQDRERYAEAIKVVLVRVHEYDSIIGDAIKDTPEKGENVAHAVHLLRLFSSKAESIDTSACPPDFAEAYSRLISATNLLADAMESFPQREDKDTLEFRDELRSWEKHLSDIAEDATKAQGNLAAVSARYGVQ